MSDSLRDQLLGLGFKPAPKPDPRPDQRGKRDERKPGHAGAARPPSPRPAHAKPHHGKPAHAHAKPAHANHAKHAKSGPARAREDIDLAKAYAIRAQKEKDARIEAERLKQEEARKRREAKARLADLLKDKALNDAGAEIARHFPYGGKIKRVYVTEDQLKRLNAGELGVVQLEGRYLLVAADVLAQAESVFAPAIALKVDPDAPAADDPYADPQYQVPDDLVW
jgi:uncharacterized protein YaiL (DUF2058 family)